MKHLLQGDGRRRLLVTLGALLIYRLGQRIPLPGISVAVLGEITRSYTVPREVSIFALDIHPWISAQLLVWVLTLFIPTLRVDGDDAGRWRRFTGSIAVAFALVQGYFVSLWLLSLGRGSPLAGRPEDMSSSDYGALLAITLAAGALLILWLGEVITIYGITNGVLLIYCIDLIDGGANGIRRSLSASEGIEVGPLEALLIIAIFVVTVVISVFVEKGVRRLQLPTSQKPLQIPLRWGPLWAPVFASSLLVLPSTLGAWSRPMKHLGQLLSSNVWVWYPLYGLVTFFVAWAMFLRSANVQALTRQLQESGAVVGDRAPGEETARFLSGFVTRFGFAYALYLAIICQLPGMLAGIANVNMRVSGLLVVLLVRASLELWERLSGDPEPEGAVSEA